MKRFLYWFLGDRAGRIVFVTWNWLWRSPECSQERPQRETVEDALKTLQQAVQHLTEIVSMQQATYTKARNRYVEKRQISEQLKEQARFALRQGNESVARLIIARGLELERVLPLLKQQLDRAESLLKASKNRLEKEQLHLETYRTKIQSFRDLSDMNAALAKAAQWDWHSQREEANFQLEALGQTIEDQYYTLNTAVDLATSLPDKVNNDWEQIDLHDEISKRLQQLKQSVMLSKSTPHPGGGTEGESQAYESA